MSPPVMGIVGNIGNRVNRCPVPGDEHGQGVARRVSYRDSRHAVTVKSFVCPDVDDVDRRGSVTTEAERYRESTAARMPRSPAAAETETKIEGTSARNISLR